MRSLLRETVAIAGRTVLGVAIVLLSLGLVAALLIAVLLVVVNSVDPLFGDF